MNNVTITRLFVLLVAGLLAMTAPTLSAQGAAQAEKLLASAQHKASIDGDLKAAIEDYKKAFAAAGSDRALAAQALLGMAECHQKLGDREAQSLYARLVQEYGDQSGPAGVARARLNGLTAAANDATPSARLLWTQYVEFTGMSPDGRQVAFTDFSAGANGNLFLRDVTTGSVRRLTANAGNPALPAPQYAGSASFSRGSRMLAYGWKTPDGYQLRVIAPDGSGERIVTKNTEHDWLAPIGWSANNDRVLAKIRVKGEVAQIAWITIINGSVEVLHSAPWLELGTVALSADARYVAYDSRAGDQRTARTVFVLSADGARRFAVTDGMAREEVCAWLPNGNRLAYISHRNGNPALFAVDILDGKPNGSAALLKSDVSGIEPIGFTTGGALYYRQVTTTGSAYLADLDVDNARISNIRAISSNLIADMGADFSPDGKHIAYIAHRGTDLARRFVAVYSVADGATRQVIPADDLSIHVTGGHTWSPDGREYQVNGQSASRLGSFAMDMSTGQLRFLFAVPNGYAQTPEWTNGGRALLFHPQPQLKRSGVIVIRDLDTGLEKIVEHPFQGADSIGKRLSPDGKLLALRPIELTGGGIRESALYVMPLTGGDARPVARVPANENIWPMGWTRDSTGIIFTRIKAEENNRNRSAAAPFASTTGLWLVRASGGQPRQIQFEPLDAVRPTFSSISVSPSGRQVAFTQTSNRVELWTLDGLLSAPTSR